jgi:hypothetical protein
MTAERGAAGMLQAPRNVTYRNTEAQTAGLTRVTRSATIISSIFRLDYPYCWKAALRQSTQKWRF